MAVTLDIDTGGTFTDGFVVVDGKSSAVKVLTTPHDLAVCFQEVVEAAADAAGMSVPKLLTRTEAVRYATTVGTNTVIQRNGPRLGLLTDVAGDDVPGTGILIEPDMVEPLPPDSAADGSGRGSEGALVGAMAGLLERSARGLVCSVAPGGGGLEAERRVENAFHEHYPRQCLDAVPLLLAGDLVDEADSARRAGTALFNAYVHPSVADFLYRAEDYLRGQGYRKPLLIVHNDGGCARVARTIAGKTYNSGPTAGLLGAASIARRFGLETVVTLDMGGTSLDVSVIRDGEVPMLERGTVEGVEIAFQLPDLRALGAGGGSIAYVEDGELRVGPRSAGAKPGPACFGFGGVEPTVTDADVVLGILRPEAFLGGAMLIDAEAAARAVGRLAAELGCEAGEAAERIRTSVHRDMGAELTSELERHGVDAAGVTVFAFGGNGATHAAGIAGAAGIGSVITFPFSPVFSAFGASTADVRHIYEAPAGSADRDGMRARAIRDMRGEGYAEADVEIDVSTRPGADTIVLEARRRMPHLELPEHEAPPSVAVPCESAEVRWPGVGVARTAIHQRAALTPGAGVAGPALVEAGETTVAVPPDWILRIDGFGAGRLSREDG